LITAGVCDSFVLESLTGGVHAPDDEYRMALYSSAANVNPQTTRYSSGGEINAMGYVTGGVELQNRRTGLVNSDAWMNFDNPTWTGTIAARGALIYNASKDNRSVVAMDFGKEIISTDDLFTVRLPPDGPQAPVVFGRR
jgi:hypothetical protein